MRVVQGGDRFVRSMLITEQVRQTSTRCPIGAAAQSLVPFAVVAADEETWIAKETVRCLRTVYS